MSDSHLNRRITAEDAAPLAAFYTRNKVHLAPWEPARDEEFYSEPFWQQRIGDWMEQIALGNADHYLTVDTAADKILATCSITNIVRGPFQACNIGYAVSADEEGSGVMSTLVRHVLNVAFNEHALNRVMANYMPRNARSARLLEKLGFEQEGIAKRYLLINGTWEDHVLTAKLNPRNL